LVKLRDNPRLSTLGYLQPRLMQPSFNNFSSNNLWVNILTRYANILDRRTLHF